MRHELNKMVGQVARAIFDGEKFAVGFLANRAVQAAEACPTDPTLVAMSNFLTKRAEKETFITRSELRNVYERLYSRNNRFAGLFAEELGLSEPEGPKVAKRDPNEGKDFTKEAAKLADPVLANALSALLDPNPQYRPYSVEMAKNASRACLLELNRFCAPKKVDVVAGRPDCLIVRAEYETPKGYASVLVPVEMDEKNALLPTVFLTEAGFADLNRETLEQHLVSTAGKRVSVDLEKVLSVVARAKSGALEPLGSVDLAIAKIKLAQGTPEAYDSGILYGPVDPAQVEVAVPRHPDADEFAKKLASTRGIAEFQFGKSAVENGRRLLNQELNRFGYRHANVSVQDCTDTVCSFAVSVDGQAAFRAAMKFENGSLQVPKVVVANGSVFSFDKQGINQMLANGVDPYQLAQASSLYGLGAKELMQEMDASIKQNNLARAEDALNCIAQSGDSQAFKTAFAQYSDAVNGNKTAKEESCCSQQRKVAYSKYIICGHTNLPVHQVYQDKHGDCLPLYRKRSEEPGAASFMHSKVYFG